MLELPDTIEMLQLLVQVFCVRVLMRLLVSALNNKTQRIEKLYSVQFRTQFMQRDKKVFTKLAHGYHTRSRHLL